MNSNNYEIHISHETNTTHLFQLLSNAQLSYYNNDFGLTIDFCNNILNSLNPNILTIIENNYVNLNTHYADRDKFNCEFRIYESAIILRMKAYYNINNFLAAAADAKILLLINPCHNEVIALKEPISTYVNMTTQLAPPPVHKINNQQSQGYPIFSTNDFPSIYPHSKNKKINDIIDAIHNKSLKVLDNALKKVKQEILVNDRTLKVYFQQAVNNRRYDVVATILEHQYRNNNLSHFLSVLVINKQHELFNFFINRDSYYLSTNPDSDYLSKAFGMINYKFKKSKLQEEALLEAKALLAYPTVKPQNHNNALIELFAASQNKELVKLFLHDGRVLNSKSTYEWTEFLNRYWMNNEEMQSIINSPIDQFNAWLRAKSLSLESRNDRNNVFNANNINHNIILSGKENQNSNINNATPQQKLPHHSGETNHSNLDMCRKY